MKEKITTVNPNLFLKFIYSLAALIGLPFLIVLSSLAFIDVNKADNTKEIATLISIMTVTYITVPILVVLVTVLWQLVARKKRETEKLIFNQKIKYYCIASCRYLLATILLYYGLSKLMGEGQLHTSFLLYGNELGSLDPSQLTWAFFSYSKCYHECIAFAEIFGALLLLFRRTTLLGALFLLPVLINITLIDYNYNINAKDIITALLLMDIFLVTRALKTLIPFFIYQKTVNPQDLVKEYSHTSTSNKTLKTMALLTVVLIAFITNYHQIKPPQTNPLTGAWKATKVINYSDTIPEKNEKLSLKLFVDGTTATLKKTYQFEDFKLSTNKQGTLMMQPYDTLHKNQLIGNYQIFHKDSLIIKGKEGKDSIYWVFKKTDR